MAGTRLNGGIALVTGAASGIGKDACFALAEAGVEAILLADLNLSTETTLQECQKFASHPNFRALSVVVDVTDEASVDNMVQRAVSELGRIDYCVHSAGISGNSRTRTATLNVDAFDQSMRTNSRGTMLVLRAVSQAMSLQEPRSYTSTRSNTTRSLGRGSIVVLSSINGLISVPGMMPYTASKHATIGIAQTAAVDNFEHHIRVNIVCPSWTDTPMMQKTISNVPTLEQAIAKLCPLGRIAMPEEVSDAVVFLCSPAASFINGESLVIDAGFTLTGFRMGH
ncbi:putative PKS/NRPS-like protein biosynthetic cluster [Aspergillus niger]|nr:putative PKS/NRPS-like protein biosynthetic cluster [Aspergillus niger]